MNRLYGLIDSLDLFQLVILSWLIAAMVVCVTMLGLWAWESFWRWYDDRMQNSKRIANGNLDAAYRTGQFHVPRTMRDFK